MVMGLKERRVRRKVEGSKPSPKGRPVASKERIPVDASTYSGRLAIRVRELREAKGWTVPKLAEKAGISEKAMYAYENGTRGIPVDLFPAIARALGASAEEFFPRLK
jgi:DNA-binding XRE family transcriptional regulator